MNYFIRKDFLSAYLMPDVILDVWHTEVKDKFLFTKSLQSGGKDKQTRKHFQCGATSAMIDVDTGAMRPSKRHLFNSRVRGADA